MSRSWLLLFATLLWFSPKRADACEPLPCQRSYMLPEAGTIPANAAGIVAFVDPPSGGNAPAITPSDAAVARRAQKSFGFDVYLVTPKGGFVAGSTLELSVASPCTFIPPAKLTSKLKITAAAPAPKALGTLLAEPLKKGELKVGTSAGSCSITEAAAWIDVTVQLDASAVPWADLLEYSTFVDGKPWRPSQSIGDSPPPGGSWVGHGRDRIYVLCPGKFGFPGTTDGEHEIVIRARVNDGPELATPAVKLLVSCSDTAVAAKSRTDPGPPPPETPDPVARPMNRSRCSCESVGAEREIPLGTLAFALTLGLAFTRRRR